MVARINSFAFRGIDMVPIDVQVQIASGLPALTIVGLLDKAVAESVAIEQCLAWHRNGAKPEDLYQQLMGRRPERSMDWDSVAKAPAGRWGRLRNGV